MARFVAIYQDYAATASFSGGSYFGLLPLSNAKTSDIGQVARTVDARPASSVIVADLGTSRMVGGVVVGPGNFSPGSTYRVVGSNFSNFTSPVFDSGVLTVVGAGLDWPDLDLFPVWAASILPSDVSARYLRIKITDSLNADGYIQFGRVVIGRAWRPSRSYARDGEFACEPIYRRVESVGGRRTDWDLGRRRGYRLAFNGLTESELFGDVFRLRQVAGSSQQVWVCPDPDDTANFQKRSFLATMKTAPSIVQAGYGFGTTVLDCEEVL